MTNEQKGIRRFVQGFNVEIQKGSLHLLKLWRKHRELRAQGCKLGTSTIKKGIFLIILLIKHVKMPHLLKRKKEREE